MQHRDLHSEVSALWGRAGAGRRLCQLVIERRCGGDPGQGVLPEQKRRYRGRGCGGASKLVPPDIGYTERNVPATGRHPSGRDNLCALRPHHCDPLCMAASVRTSREGRSRGSMWPAGAAARRGGARHARRKALTEPLNEPIAINRGLLIGSFGGSPCSRSPRWSEHWVRSGPGTQFLQWPQAHRAERYMTGADWSRGRQTWGCSCARTTENAVALPCLRRIGLCLLRIRVRADGWSEVGRA